MNCIESNDYIEDMKPQCAFSKIEKTWQDGQFDIHQNIKPEYDIGSGVCTYGIHLI